MTEPGPAPESPNSTPTPPPPRHRRRQFLWLLVPLLLLTGIIIGAQMVLRTDLPLRIALARLQRETGLRITASSLSTGWLGHSILDNVSISLPLDQQPFLQVPRLEVSHNTLPALLIDRPFRLTRIRLDHPRLLACQTPAGTWNVLEALTLARESFEQANPGNSISPEQFLASFQIGVDSATVVLTDSAGQSITLSPLTLQGMPAAPGAWQFLANLAPDLRIAGRVAPQQGWEHQLTFSLRQIDQLLKPWLPMQPAPSQLEGTWAGRLVANQLVGQLTLAEARLDRAAFSGDLHLQIDQSAATVTPGSLTATLRDQPSATAQWHGGTLHVTASRLRADALQLKLLNGAARLDGQYDWHAQSANLDAAWSNLMLPGEIRHTGQFHAQLDTPLANHPRITGRLQSAGHTPQGDWTAQATIAAQGDSWSVIRWRLAFPELTWRGKPTGLALKDLAATLVTEPNAIRLAELSLPDPQRLSGAGQLNLKDRQWQLSLAARNLALPRWSTPADCTLAVAGAFDHIKLSSFQVHSGGATLSANASYDFKGAQPFEAQLTLAQPPISVPGPTPNLTLAGGGLRGEARVRGTAAPLQADIAAQLAGKALVLGSRPLGDLTVHLNGKLDADTLRLQSKELRLLDSRCTVSGRYVFGTGSADLGLDITGLSLKQIDGLTQTPLNAEGLLDATLKLDLPNGDRNRLAITGDWQVYDFKRGPLQAEHVVGRLSLSEQNLLLSDIRLAQKAGHAQAQIRYNLREPSRLAVQAEFQNWPFQDPRHSVDLALSGRTRLDVVPSTQPAATGPLDLAASVRFQGKDLGTVEIESLVQGRQLQVPSLKGRLLGATLAGRAALTFDDLLNSSAKIEWRDLDVPMLVACFPRLQGLQGSFAGTLEAAKTTNPNIPEPLSIQIVLQAKDAQFRGMNVGDGSLLLLLGRSSPGSPPWPNRAVVDRSTFNLAGGQANLWARAVSLGEAPFSLLHTQLDFQSLDLDQIVHALEPSAEPMIGRLAGRVTVFGPRQDHRRLAGNARLQLTNANLHNSDVVAAFHRKYDQRAEALDAVGTASARLRLENGTIQLLNLLYQVKGLEMRAYGVLNNAYEGIDSPMQGWAIGSTRPLRSIKLPYFAELDDMLHALQASVTTFRIGGTVRQPTVAPAAISDINQTFRDVIIGDVQSDSPQ